MSTSEHTTTARAAATPLREVSGLDSTPPRLGATALVMIDFQNTYRTGVMALEGADAALAEAARLLERARAAGIPVVHVVHDAGAGSPYDLRAHSGAVCDEVAPVDGEPVVAKAFPDSFHATALEETLTGLGFAPDMPDSRTDLVLAGFMTHMCVASTAQSAFHRGYRPTVVADATATRALAAPDGTVVPASVLKTAALTTVTDTFGVVARTADDLDD